MKDSMINKKFGRLKVISREGTKSSSKEPLYKCLCDCGNIITIGKYRLTSKTRGTKSCGCLRKEVTSKRFSQNLIGKKFNKLTVIKEVGREKGKGIKWLCECECGNTTTLYTKQLNSNSVKSCGCLSHKHGQFGTRLYQTWADMKRRCYNETNKSYKYYGALGVTVCNSWKNNFENFYNWSMKNGYTDTLTIDRINPFGNYEPSNCRWITRSEQAYNKRKNYKKNS